MFLDLAGVVIVAFLASVVACRFMMSRGPVDRADEDHKWHPAPTPTSGGVGIGIGFAAGMIALSLLSIEWRHAVAPQGGYLLWLAALFAYPLLIVGYIDDTRNLDARLKFAVYGALSVGAAWAFGVVDELPLGGRTIAMPFALAFLGTALWVFTMLNCVNFMDGANGLAMGSVAVGLLALASISIEGATLSALALTLCGAGALIGFLVWNFPRGHLFAGDSGALFAGAIASFASLIVIHRAGISPFIPPIVFLPLLADTLLTLFWRVRQRRSLFVGHSEHVYQLLIGGGLGHARVAMVYWAAMAVCGAVAYFAARDESQTAPWVALATLAALSIPVTMLVRRWARAHNIIQP